jgi:hypothetical protein
MRAGSLENELLRVGVLADKGTDVFEFNYKPCGMDFVWPTADCVRNPTSLPLCLPRPFSHVYGLLPRRLAGVRDLRVLPLVRPPLQHRA